MCSSTLISTTESNFCAPGAERRDVGLQHLDVVATVEAHRELVDAALREVGRGDVRAASQALRQLAVPGADLEHVGHRGGA